MIVDLERFIKEERPYWTELEELINRFQARNNRKLSIDEVENFNRLYHRTTADLSKVQTYTANQEIHQYLENLAARAYSEIHSQAGARHYFQPLQWFFVTFPATFRKHIRAFLFSVLVTFAGAILGAFALTIDEEAKAVIMPFSHLHGDPSDRVAEEESMAAGNSDGHLAFAAQLMTHNTKVSITTLSFGITWGIGTLIMLFYNGVILGAVCLDYIQAGESVFLCAWLLPHGSVEIPAILLAGQAGFIIAHAMIGRNQALPFARRLRAISGDVVTLIFGIGIMLIWAGIIEAFLSQHHEPTISYLTKIAFGTFQLMVLFTFLAYSGRSGHIPFLPRKNES